MSDDKGVTPEVEATNSTTEPMPITVTDEVASKLAEFGATDAAVSKIKELGVESVDDLALLTESNLTDAGILLIQARKLMDALTPAPSAAEVATINNNALEGLLPSVQDDESFLISLKAGGVLKVDTSTVTSAVRAALAKRVGLYDVPAKLVAAMEQYADESEDQVDPIFYELREQMTRRSYADIFAAVPGLNGSFVTDKRKHQLLDRFDELFWPAFNGFNDQLKGWQESWLQGASPNFMVMAMMGGKAKLPPGVMQAPDTAVLRDSADAVKDAVNKVFAGTGVQIATALAFEALEIKKSIMDPRLPALTGTANREQMLKKLGIAVSANYPRLETNLTKYVLGILSLEDQASGDEELSYLSALFMLGSQINSNQLESSSNGYSTLGRTLKGRDLPELTGRNIPRRH